MADRTLPTLSISVFAVALALAPLAPRAKIAPGIEDPLPLMPPFESHLDSEAPLVEPVLVLFEDMANGRFDAFHELGSGSGSYGVVDDGTGNLVARMTGDKTLEMHGAAWTAKTWHDYEIRLVMKRSASGTVAFGFREIPTDPESTFVVPGAYWLQIAGQQWTLSRLNEQLSTQLATATGPSADSDWHALRIAIAGTDNASEARIQVFLGETRILDVLDSSPIPYGRISIRTSGTGAVLWLDDVIVVEYVDPRFTWSQAQGPEGISGGTALAVDPRNWRVALTGGLDAGLFKTTDGGRRWNEIGLSREMWTPRVLQIEFAPSDPDVIYIGAGGKHISPLWRSDDSGATWHSTDFPSQPEGYAEADTPAIAIDPADPLHIYFGISAGVAAVPQQIVGLYESTDGGASYTHIYPASGRIGPIELDPDDPQHILAGSLTASQSGFSIVASPDGGATWDNSSSGIPTDDIAEILFYPPDTDYVFAVSFTLAPEVGANLYRSTDGGKTWKTLASSPRANSLRFTSQPVPTLYAQRADGLFASTDKGETWSAIANSACLGTSFVFGIDDPSVTYSITPPSISVSRDLGKTCSTSTKGLLAHPVAGLGISPSEPKIVYIGTMGGLYKSTDAGWSWQLLRKGGYAGIAVDPTDSDTVYIGTQELRQVFKSTDGGSTWSDITGSIAYPGVSTLEIDPNNPLVVFAGTGHGPQLAPSGGGLYKSTNGGGSWRRLPGIPDAAVPAIAIFPQDSSRMAVAVLGYGIYVSDDAGETFLPRNNGFVADAAGRQTWALAMHPSNSDIMYAATSVHYGKAGDASWDALYKTTDGGLNWKVLLGSSNLTGSPYDFIARAPFDGIAINPKKPEEVYVAVHDPGIIFTENGGKDWRYVNYGLVPVLVHVYPYRLGISRDGSILYATSCGRSIFRNYVGQAERPKLIPSPEIKANGDNQSIILAPGEPLSLSLTFDPSDFKNRLADWWFFMESAAGFTWFTMRSGWVTSGAPQRAHGGPLVDLPRWVEVPIDTAAWTSGDYRFFFGVDGNMDGALDGTFLDSVLVSVP